MSLAENLAFLAQAITADAGGNALALNTPAIGNNTKALATTEFVRNEFAGTGRQSIANTGYQRLPGGLILLWGNVGSVSAGATATISLPITVTSLFAAIPIANGSADCTLTVLNYTTTTFQAKNNGASTVANVFWIAFAN